jgi:hypothetical protein
MDFKDGEHVEVEGLIKTTRRRADVLVQVGESHYALEVVNHHAMDDGKKAELRELNVEFLEFSCDFMEHADWRIAVQCTNRIQMCGRCLLDAHEWSHAQAVWNAYDELCRNIILSEQLAVSKKRKPSDASALERDPPTPQRASGAAAAAGGPQLQYRNASNLLMSSVLMQAAREESARSDGWKKRKPEVAASNEPAPSFYSWMDEKWDPLPDALTRRQALPLSWFQNPNPCNSEFPFKRCACTHCDDVRDRFEGVHWIP